jgi:hypothetical protein
LVHNDGRIPEKDLRDEGQETEALGEAIDLSGLVALRPGKVNAYVWVEDELKECIRRIHSFGRHVLPDRLVLQDCSQVSHLQTASKKTFVTF